MSTFPRIVFIGAGAMGEAMISRLIGSGLVPANQVIAAEPRDSQREYLKQKYGIGVTPDNKQALAESTLVFLAVKPQVLPEILPGLAGAVKPSHLVVSFVTGITLGFLEKNCPPRTPIWRVMPNTPALVGAGMMAYCSGSAVSPDAEKILVSLLSALGEVLKVPESYMDAVTGVSGSGPAFVIYFLEAMINGGIKAGLPRDVATRLAVQTLYGTACMLKEEKISPSLLREKVTSAGGTTIYGLHVLENGAVGGSVMEAIFQAAQRARELSK
ncbi:MAG: pyrroline-5-carboxylate reductase [Bacillota bacterium]